MSSSLKDSRTLRKNNTTVYWKVAYWVLLTGWMVGAGLNMAHYQGGFLTNYLSDVAFPPWFYITIRGLQREHRAIPRLVFVGKWYGRSPERAALSIFAVGVMAEFKTLYWPNGPIEGVYDPWDIFAYAVGLLICYYFDKVTLER